MNALGHLTSRLVGEGERDNRRLGNAALEEPRDPMRDDSCLARSCAGEHQQRPVLMLDRAMLCRIEGAHDPLFKHGGAQG